MEIHIDGKLYYRARGDGYTVAFVEDGNALCNARITDGILIITNRHNRIVAAVDIYSDRQRFGDFQSDIDAIAKRNACCAHGGDCDCAHGAGDDYPIVDAYGLPITDIVDPNVYTRK